VPDQVVILGGGVAGMSAAHELAERGFKVAVYEKQPTIPGGKARSLPVPGSGVGGRKDLPAEHGFRFFPGFYRHLPDTMKRIPFGHNSSVFDNLEDTEETQLARVGGQALYSPTHFPILPSDLYLAFQFFFRFGKMFGIPSDDTRFFIGRLLVLMTSCEDRRFAEYEKQSWWDFIEADKRSEPYRRYLADKLSRSLVAIQPKQLSTRTGGYILLQFLYNFATPGGNALDRVLNAPTNEAWIDPWLTYLHSRGVDYHQNAVVSAIHCEGQRITGVTVNENGKPAEVTGDYYLAALPVDVIQPLISDTMKTADPQLAKLANVHTASMNGILFYLKKDVPIVRGHSNYCDAAWALTSISQPQFWPDVDVSNRGDGTVRGVLSVIISDWNTPGELIAKPANQCTKKEVGDEVWFQLKKHLNNGHKLLDDNDRVGEPFFPPSIQFGPPNQSIEPLLINTVNSWDSRPHAMTMIENFFLASDYVQTYTDLACMEGANEAARRAVNGILMVSESTAERCDVWPLHEPLLFAPERLFDQWRFDHGLPHLFPRALAVQTMGPS
jgi:uncharacterized protein with NAD-binding domain and iron-sulfur cluster